MWRWTRTLSLVALLSSAASAAPPPPGDAATVPAVIPAVVPIIDLDLSCDRTLVRGAEARLELDVLRATDLVTRTAAAGATVSVGVVTRDAPPRDHVLWTGQTDAGGHVSPRFVVPPDLAIGGHKLFVAAAGARVERNVAVRDDSLVQLRVDRTLYRPGSTIRWRVAWLRTANAHPVAGARVAVDIVDPRGTSVWSGSVTTDARGLASGELPLAEDLLTGDYELRASAGQAQDRLTVTVRPFELPPFLIDLEIDAASLANGRLLSGTAHAHTAYGEAVVGLLRVSAELPDGTSRELLRREVQGETLPFSLPLSAGHAGTGTVIVTATDGAGREVTTRREVVIGRPGLDLAVVVAGGVLQAGAPQLVQVLTTDASGAPIPADLVVTVRSTSGDVLATTTHESPGAASVPVNPPADVERSDTVVTGQLSSWRLEHSADFFADGEPDTLLGRTLQLSADRMALCLEDLAVTIDATFEGRAWRLDAVRTRPFADRPDFVMDAPEATTECIRSRLLPNLPAERAATRRTRASLSVTLARQSRDVTSSRRLREVELVVTAHARDGRTATHRETLRIVDAKDDARVVRIARPVVPPGASIEVRTLWGAAAGPVYATLLRHGAPVAVARCRVDGAELVADLPVPPGTYGLVAVRVHEFDGAPTQPPTAPRFGAANAFIMPSTLDIAIDMPQRSKPGAATALAIAVSGPDGQPVAGAGLVAAIVDERLLALATPQRDLSDVLAKDDIGAIEARGELFGRLLRRPNRTVIEEEAMRALVASVPLEVHPPEVLRPARDRFLAERRYSDEVVAAALPVLVRTAGPVVVVDAAGEQGLVATLEAVLKKADWKPAAIASPFGVPRTWEDVATVQPHLTPDMWAENVTSQRIDLLARRLQPLRAAVKARLKRGGPFDPAQLVRTRYLASDGWGAAFVLRADPADGWVYLTSPGADGVLDTPDDLVHTDVFAENSMVGGIGYFGSGAGGGGAGRAFMRVGSASVRGQMVGADPQVAPLRERFDETALWVVGETTGADGRARLPFTLPDSVTGWDVHVEAIGADGAVGVGRAHVETFLPLHLEVQAPRQLTVGDTHEVATYVTNHEPGGGALHVTLGVEGGLRVDGAAARTLDVPPGETRVARFMVRAERAGAGRLVASLRDATGERDAVARDVAVEGQGLEQRLIVPGELRAGAQELTVRVPEDADPNTVRGRLRVYRGAADQVLDGLEGMLREPHGCFEQTTSTTYPNLLVLRLLESSRKADPRAIATARELVGKGYQRLLRYEVRGGGFSWFGDAPAHLALTAFGVMEFSDMAEVYPVDRAVISRTRAWMKRQQQTDGSYPVQSRWSPDPDAVATTAFVTWSLTETGAVDASVRRGLGYLRAHRRAMADRPYALAVWAAAEARAGGRPEVPLALLDGLRINEETGATYPAGTGTLFLESGRLGRVDTTALVATARILAHTGQAPQEELRWLWGARHPSYGWGTTQGTVQALRAAVLAQGGTTAAVTGKVGVTLDGASFGTLDLDADALPTVTLPAGLAPGAHQLALSGAEDISLYTDLRLAWRTREAPAPRSEGLVVHLESAASAVAAGSTLRMTVAVANPGAASVRMPTLVIPVPPGFAADRASLDHLVATTPVTRFDALGDQINLYLTELGPGDGLVLPYLLEATTPCEVFQAPAQAYAYYAPDVRGASAPLRLQVTRRAPTTASARP